MSDTTVLRTPDDRFRGLDDFPWEPRYLENLEGFEQLRMHYLDERFEGSDGPTFLCLHGEPTWSYLYRKMIPVFLESGGRVVAPDFFGFGRSDKPVSQETYTYGFHRESLLRLIEKLDLERVTLVGQDWGGILGLTLPMEYPDRIERLIVMNTALPTGRHAPGPGFLAWKAYVREHPDLDVAALMSRAVPGITAAEMGAYAAPFPDSQFKAGVRAFPEIVPVTPEMEGAGTSRLAAEFLEKDWLGLSFMAIGVQDPVLGRPIMEHLQQMIRGCPEPLILEDAGHFVQEAGAEVAHAALASFAPAG